MWIYIFTNLICFVLSHFCDSRQLKETRKWSHLKNCLPGSWQPASLPCPRGPRLGAEMTWRGHSSSSAQVGLPGPSGGSHQRKCWDLGPPIDLRSEMQIRFQWMKKYIYFLHDPFVLDIECISRFSHTQNTLWPKLSEGTATGPQRPRLRGWGDLPGRARGVSGKIPFKKHL